MTSVKGLRRVPRPPARITAFIRVDTYGWGDGIAAKERREHK